ncbi:putative quinol monooxygenase [Microbacterium fluvii]|uniref:Quinol monooxygenase n=1 Tax=Microbacterium fluvii TaxID=415215 RepID=A0ABW2HDT1_9MICO|nr:putative quinol monooxygenase [Microbacterium fluvii]MCU4673120.1 antibiotic biosynthesis monooxygenase [Microbacterium fluvii]
MSAVVVVAVFTPRDGMRQALVDAMRAGIEATHAERGCLLYAIHDADDGTVTMIEKWATLGDLDAHAAGDAIALLQRDTTPLLAAPVVVTTMTPLPVGDPARGALAHTA